ncbi:MAG: hypothetical protein ACREGC_00115 [Minisyncoccia bacterium]
MADITFDATASGFTTSSATFDYTHVMGSVTNGVVLVYCADPSFGGAGGTPTYAGNAMTLAGNSGNGSLIWYFVNPPAGSNTVHVDFGGAPNAFQIWMSIAVSYANVNQTTPVVSASAGFNAAPSGTTTTGNMAGAASDAIVGCAAHSNTGAPPSVTAGSGFTQRNILQQSHTGNGSTSFAEDQTTGLTTSDPATYGAGGGAGHPIDMVAVRLQQPPPPSDISKISGDALANIAKVSGVAKASIHKVSGVFNA